MPALILISFFFVFFYSVFTIKYNNQRVNLEQKLNKCVQYINYTLIERVSGVASSLAKDRNIETLCAKGGPSDFGPAIIAQEAIKNSTAAVLVYIMGVNGQVISSTRYDNGKKSLTGVNYKFRPYFKEAMAGRNCIYPAVGVTTGERGIYFSSPVKDAKNSRVTGVVVIKMGTADIDRELENLDVTAVLVSPEGIIFCTNKKEWYLRPVFPVNSAVIGGSRQFEGYKTDVIGAKNILACGDERIGGVDYIVKSSPVDIDGWRLVLLEPANAKAPITAVQKEIILTVLFSIAAVIFILVMIFINRRTRNELKGEKQNYREIFDNIRDSIFIHDASTGRVIDINKKTVEMFGFSREEMFHGFPQNVSADDSPYIPEKALDIIRKTTRDIPQVFEWKCIDKGGRKFWTEVSLIKSRMHGRDVVIAMVRDISDRKASEGETKKLIEELKRSNSELQDFAYAASHDMKEPLRMVSSYVQLLEKRYKGRLDGDADEFINYAVGGVKQIQRLIDDLLAYSRVNSKGGEFVPVDLNESLERVKNSLMFKIEEKKAAVTNGKLPVVMMDPLQSEQLFLNLIGNSLKFSREGIPPVIEINCEKKDGMWEFTVKDNGIGIKPEYFERIFVIFQKLHSRDEYEGTGIGLAICKKIIERHKGMIWLESVPDSGTTFHFTIPV
jgi:PAS domain S-box-containing protein